jgi:hypothetical protein
MGSRPCEIQGVVRTERQAASADSLRQLMVERVTRRDACREGYASEPGVKLHLLYRDLLDQY